MLLYRALLLLYPASWRSEYAGEMRAVFAARLGASTGFGVPALWLELIADLLIGAAAVHFDLLRQDLRQAARAFRRSPGFAATAIAITALGIGATTAAFTMVDHALIRPLPFVDADRLVKLYEVHQGLYWDASPANYRDWKRMSTSFENMGAYRGLSVNLTGQGDPITLEGASVTADLFPVLGAQPMLGRRFTAEDDRDGAPGTVLLSYSLWQGLFGGDPAILGRKLQLYDAPYTVIGVMPPTFQFPNREAQLWTAMRWAPDAFEDRTDTYIYVVARFKPGTPFERAQAEMQTIGAQLARAYPKEIAKLGVAVVRLRDDVSRQSVLALKVLFGAAICVLLIVCTNLANLMLARAMVRRRELAVRAALGAGRERLIRQMLTESLLLAFAGGALGILIARGALPLLASVVPISLPIAGVPVIDSRILVFAAAVTCLTGVVFGVIPALRALNGASESDLHASGRSGIGARRERFRSALVATEIAGSVVLLVGFGLLTRALLRIQSIDPGFRTDHVLTLRTALPIPRYEKPETRETFYRQVLDQARALPGVTGAAYISFLPMTVRGGIWPVEVVGRPEPLSERRTASLRFVTPDFFGVMGIPIVQGRDVATSDSASSPYVAVVSRALVRRYWPDKDPIGRHIQFGNHDRVIIGVVEDIHVRGLERSSEPQVYLSWQQADGVAPWYSPKDLVVHCQGDPMSLAPALRRIIHQADPSQPVSDVRPMSAIVEGETTARRVQLNVLAAFGVVAFMLAAVGIHGLLDFAVASRTQEIGVRMALGARRVDILGMTLRDALRLAVAGVVVGFVLAYGAGRMLESLLAGVRPGDIATFAAAGVLAIAMTLAGSFTPALRAMRVDPTVAMRAE